MNLGQLIGELQMRAEAAGAPPAQSAAVESRPPRPKRALRSEISKRIVAAIESADRALAPVEVLARAKIPAEKLRCAYVYLFELSHSGHIARTGSRRGYLYMKAPRPLDLGAPR